MARDLVRLSLLRYPRQVDSVTYNPYDTSGGLGERDSPFKHTEHKFKVIFDRRFLLRPARMNWQIGGVQYHLPMNVNAKLIRQKIRLNRTITWTSGSDTPQNDMYVLYMTSGNPGTGATIGITEIDGFAKFSYYDS